MPQMMIGRCIEPLKRDSMEFGSSLQENRMAPSPIVEANG
jgi:hypothetical protein